jgi:hypothetical protein
LIRLNPSATRQAWTRRAADFIGTVMKILPTMMMSIMTIALVAMIYAVRLAGCFAIVFAFLPAAFWRSLTKRARNSLNGRTF